MRFRNADEIDKGANQFCLTNMMGAISFIYNMTTKSLTLDGRDKIVAGTSASPNLFGNASTQNKSAVAANRQRDMNKIANQVSTFFSNIYKEVKTNVTNAVDEMANLSVSQVDQGTPLTTISTTSPSETTSATGDQIAGTTNNSSVPSHLKDVESPTRLRQEEEDYELQLAMALSLSESTAAQEQMQIEAGLKKDGQGLLIDVCDDDPEKDESNSVSASSSKSSPNKGKKSAQ